MTAGRLKVWNYVTEQWEYVSPGLAGPTGPSGATGATGPQGATGPSGGVSTTGAQALENKRIIPRVRSRTSISELYGSSDYDVDVLSAQSENLSISIDSYSPDEAERRIYRIKDNGTARAITWHSLFKGVGLTLPTTTVAGKWLYIGAIYNASTSKWDVIAVSLEA